VAADAASRLWRECGRSYQNARQEALEWISWTVCGKLHSGVALGMHVPSGENLTLDTRFRGRLPTEAERKPPRIICAWKVLLDLANLKTKSSGDGCSKKAIEKTVLCFLGSHTFSHGLDPKRSLTKQARLGGLCLDVAEAERLRCSQPFPTVLIDGTISSLQWHAGSVDDSNGPVDRVNEVD
jgi:hypothetical protein